MTTKRFNKKYKDREISNTIDPGATYSQESEEAILGLVLHRPEEALDEVRETLTQTDFFVPAHQEIFQAICDLQDRMMNIDTTIVHQLLVDRKMHEAVGSPNILSLFLSKAAFIYGYKTHLRLIKDKSLLRQLQLAMGDITVEIAMNAENSSELVDFANERMSEVGATRSSETEENHAKLALRTFAIIKKMHTDKNPNIGVLSQYPPVDRKITCFEKGNFILLGARPGVGKSAFAINMKDKMSYSKVNSSGDTEYPGHVTGFFGLEMTSEEVQKRSISSLSGISLKKIRESKCEEAELQKIEGISKQMAEFPGYFEEDPMITLAGIRSKSRKWVRKHKVEIIFVDYLQLINHHSERGSRAEAVAEMSRGLKCMAKELMIPVIALAQLNRDADEDKRPKLEHLRESGALEQDADVVLFLHPKEKAEDGVERQMLNYELIIAKQRNGPTGIIDLEYKPSIVRFFYPNEVKP